MSNAIIARTPSRSNRIDLTGQRFGNLVVVAEAKARDKWGKMRWDCLCDCGNRTTVNSGDLRCGHTHSCGCLSSRKTLAQRRITHGLSQTRIYHIWHGMIQRCYDVTVPHYPRYGGRGIPICAAWRNSFAAFYADMAEGYASHLTLDRKDNNGPYCKENCRWSTPTEQSNNTRRNRRLTFNGRTQTIAQWSRELGIKQTTIAARLYIGWDIHRALTEPVHRSNRSKTY